MLQKELIAKKDYAAIGEEISHEMAADFIRNFDRDCPYRNQGFYDGKKHSSANTFSTWLCRHAFL